MSNSKFEDLKNYIINKNVLITSHNLVDIDGLVSCFILKFFFNFFSENERTIIYLPEISKSTRTFIDRITLKFPKLELNYVKEVSLSNFDVILILDTSNLAQTNLDVLESRIPFIFIDHHFYLKNDYKFNLKSLNIIIDEISSTSEIVFEMFKYFNLKIPLPYKYLLISGILADSGNFKYGNNDTIIRVSELLDNQVDFQEILSMMKNDTEIPEKIAKIKGLQRAQLIQHGVWLIGITYVGSYEANVAKSLIQIGFDVGIVYSNKKSKFRISTRAPKYVCGKTGLHLGKILEEVSNEFEASGGGHDGAASLNGTNNLEEILDKIIYKIKLILNN
jgi:nanoRNase/pAp phosphatase (c-di-AMP/oligoRNAs hydrolase)